MHRKLLSAVAAVLTAFLAPAFAQTGSASTGSHAGHHVHGQETASATFGELEITGGWARAMLPGQPTGGAYLTIRNSGAEADRLVSASSPAAEKVELHTMQVSGDVMVMRPLPDGIEIPAGKTVELKPGGLHLMFMQVAKPFALGGEIPVELEFEKAGEVEIILPVRAANSGDEDHSGH